MFSSYLDSTTHYFQLQLLGTARQHSPAAAAASRKRKMEESESESESESSSHWIKACWNKFMNYIISNPNNPNKKKKKKDEPAQQEEG